MAATIFGIDTPILSHANGVTNVVDLSLFIILQIPQAIKYNDSGCIFWVKFVTLLILSDQRLANLSHTSCMCKIASFWSIRLDCVFNVATDYKEVLGSNFGWKVIKI